MNAKSKKEEEKKELAPALPMENISSELTGN